jgi:hypothetical protein
MSGEITISSIKQRIMPSELSIKITMLMVKEMKR